MMPDKFKIDDERIGDSTKEELIARLRAETDPNSPLHEQMKAAILVRCTQDIEKSMADLAQTLEQTSRSTNLLSAALLLATLVLGWESFKKLAQFLSSLFQ